MTFGRVGGERIGAAVWGAAFTAALALLIIFGSHFDAALAGCTNAVLTFAITYRCATWLHRPPTRIYWVQDGDAIAPEDEAIEREVARQTLTHYIDQMERR